MMEKDNVAPATAEEAAAAMSRQRQRAATAVARGRLCTDYAALHGASRQN